MGFQILLKAFSLPALLPLEQLSSSKKICHDLEIQWDDDHRLQGLIRYSHGYIFAVEKLKRLDDLQITYESSTNIPVAFKRKSFDIYGVQGHPEKKEST